MKKVCVAGDDAVPAEYSSPPCYAHEFPGYFGEDEADAGSRPLPHCADRRSSARGGATVPEEPSPTDGESPA
mgnify:FL=1